MSLPYVVSSILSLSEPSVLRLFSSGGFIDLVPPSTLPADYNFVLPPDIGNNGEFLITDGSGNTSWSTNTAPENLEFLEAYSTSTFSTTSTSYVSVPGMTIDLTPFNTAKFFHFIADFNCLVTGTGNTEFQIAIFTTSEPNPLFSYLLTIDPNAPTAVCALRCFKILTSSDIIDVQVKITSGTSITITNRSFFAFRTALRY